VPEHVTKTQVHRSPGVVDLARSRRIGGARVRDRNGPHRAGGFPDCGSRSPLPDLSHQNGPDDFREDHADVVAIRTGSVEDHVGRFPADHDETHHLHPVEFPYGTDDGGFAARRA